jgi:hypothetical protein
MYHTVLITYLKLFYTKPCMKQLGLQILTCFIQTHLSNNFDYRRVVLYNPVYKTTFVTDLKLFYTNPCIKQLWLQILSFLHPCIKQLKVCNQTMWQFWAHDEVLPEDGAVSAETCRIVLIIIHVYYYECSFCWYNKDIIIIRKMHGMESCKVILSSLDSIRQCS